MVAAEAHLPVASTDSLKDALERIQRAGLDGLPVVEDGQLVGVLTRRAAALFVRRADQGRGRRRAEGRVRLRRARRAARAPEGEGTALVTAVADRLRTVEEARAAILAAIPAPLGEETVPVGAALGRVLARPVVAAVTLPPWDNSAMDGYAIRAADVAAPPRTRRSRLDGRAARCRPAASPSARSSPGARFASRPERPIPSGADAVVPVEQTTPLDAAGDAGARGRDAAGPMPAAILVHAAVAPGGAHPAARQRPRRGRRDSRRRHGDVARRGRAGRRRGRRRRS